MIEGRDGIQRVSFGGKYLQTVKGFYDLGLHSICNNSLIKFVWFYLSQLTVNRIEWISAFVYYQLLIIN